MLQNAVGTAELFVNGEKVRLSDGEITFDPRRIRNGPRMVGLDGSHAEPKEQVAPWFDIEARHHSRNDIQRILNMEDATITLRLASGEVWNLSEASCTTDSADVSVKTGTYKLRFEGVTMEKSS